MGLLGFEFKETVDVGVGGGGGLVLLGRRVQVGELNAHGQVLEVGCVGTYYRLLLANQS